MHPKGTNARLISLGASAVDQFDRLRATARQVALCALFLALGPLALRAGWSFDTGLSPEPVADLLASASMPQAPAGSWLRLRGIEQSTVIDSQGLEGPLYPGAHLGVSVARRRAALQRLRAQSYRLVALLGWEDTTWAQGVRDPKGLRQTPLDLRETFDRCRLLAATYGDLIDYWEIGNEPDIAFVEENPETYVAFLKACCLGIRRGWKEGQEQKAPASPGASRVLMGALALPPGPWLEAFVANGGLNFTDGFNYHYYGYAEDFTGVNQQFEEAVNALATKEALSPQGNAKDTKSASGVIRDGERPESVFETNFLPSAQGWMATTVGRFDFSGESAEANRAFLLSRPLAVGEPALVPQGRWLVSPGVTVEETAAGWRFHVVSWSPQPLRPAMAELPLPAGWRADSDALLTFEYRLAPSLGGARSEGESESSVGPALAAEPSAAGRPSPSASSPLPALKRSSTRELPVFLTEYGYGLLSKEARVTVEGRERQRAWFASVSAQAHDLGIEGAMAFQLTPFLEQNTNEFGLLMGGHAEAPGGKRQAVSGKPWGGYAMSPALMALLDEGEQQSEPRTWTVPTAAPSPVVIDFVAGRGLKQAKNYGGYFSSGDYGRKEPAQGMIVLYNFGDSAQTGGLTLEGDSWTLADGTKSLTLTLSSGERREVPVRIVPPGNRFVPHPARAAWHAIEEEKLKTAEGARPPARAGLEKMPAPKPAPGVTRSEAESRGLRTPAPGQALFDVYFRTRNGNLFQTWQRLWANDGRQLYMERMGNYTMAFYGRAHLPWSFENNEPVALAFFFRPEHLPATFDIRAAQVVNFAAP